MNFLSEKAQTFFNKMIGKGYDREKVVIFLLAEIHAALMEKTPHKEEMSE